MPDREYIYPSFWVFRRALWSRSPQTIGRLAQALTLIVTPVLPGHDGSHAVRSSPYHKEGRKIASTVLDRF